MAYILEKVPKPLILKRKARTLFKPWSNMYLLAVWAVIAHSAHSAGCAPGPETQW